jgi:toxin FitB
LRYRIARQATGKRRDRLDDWLRKDLGSRFEGRILPVDVGIADACGRLVARSESLGRPIEPRDAFIAATAEVLGLTLVTRNAADFEPTVKAIVTPWT